MANLRAWLAMQNPTGTTHASYQLRLVERAAAQHRFKSECRATMGEQQKPALPWWIKYLWATDFFPVVPQIWKHFTPKNAWALDRSVHRQRHEYRDNFKFSDCRLSWWRNCLIWQSVLDHKDPLARKHSARLEKIQGLKVHLCGEKPNWRYCFLLLP